MKFLVGALAVVVAGVAVYFGVTLGAPAAKAAGEKIGGDVMKGAMVTGASWSDWVYNKFGIDLIPDVDNGQPATPVLPSIVGQSKDTLSRIKGLDAWERRVEDVRKIFGF